MQEAIRVPLNSPNSILEEQGVRRSSVADRGTGRVR